MYFFYCINKTSTSEVISKKILHINLKTMLCGCRLYKFSKISSDKLMSMKNLKMFPEYKCIIFVKL
jgi:hypothetical protein